MNDGMYSSITGEHGTPQDFFDVLDAEFSFTLDAAATKKNNKVKRYWTASAHDALLEPKWDGRVWLNPPYGRGLMPWIDKVIEQTKNCEVIVVLLPARTDTQWWRKAARFADEVRLIEGRLTFEIEGGGKNGAPFPSCLMIFRTPRRASAMKRTKIRTALT